MQEQLRENIIETIENANEVPCLDFRIKTSQSSRVHAQDAQDPHSQQMVYRANEKQLVVGERALDLKPRTRSATNRAAMQVDVTKDIESGDDEEDEE